MSTKTKRLVRLITFGIILMSGFLFTSAGVSAVTSETDLLNKALLNGLRTCYQPRYMQHDFDATNNAYASVPEMMTANGSSENIIKIPNQIGNSLSTANITCKELFDGKKNSFGRPQLNGILSAYGKGVAFDKMGYEARTKTEKKCFYISYEYTYNNTTQDAETNRACFTIDDENNLVKDDYGNYDPVFEESSKHGPDGKDLITLVTGENSESNAYISAIELDGSSLSVDIKISGTWSGLMTSASSAVNKIDGKTITYYKKDTGAVPMNISGATAKSSTDSSQSAAWKIIDDDCTTGCFYESASLEALSYITGQDYPSWYDYKFTEAEKYDLLVNYYNRAKKDNPSLAINGNKCAPNLDMLYSAYGSSLGIWSSDKKAYCIVTGYESVSGNFNVVNDNYNGLKETNFAGVIGALAVIDFDDPSFEGREDGIDTGTGDISGGTTDPDDPDSGGDDDEPEINCMNGGGSKSLGWIICSALDLMSGAATKAYDFVGPSLETDTNVISNPNIHDVWSAFRDIANVAFIIFIMVIVFSQLTGVGIDNYGIKKILPKLIIAAVLVNLSFIICELAVDLSNILGVSLKSFFNNIPVGDISSVQIEGDTVAVEATGRLAGLGVLAGVAVAAGAFWANPAIVLSLLVSALGVVIAIFFLFILLAAREAAIVVLVVLSPVAIVCYMLPNTQNIFKKWYKIFAGLLLVFPICGLLVGGGNFVSKLLLTSGGEGFIKVLTGMVVGIIPIFFIPTVLKSSFSALGNLGAKISGIGKSLSGTATKAARGTDVYKNAQEMGQRRATRFKAGVDKDGQAKDIKGIGRLLRGGKYGMAKARSQYLSDRSIDYKKESLMGAGFDAARISQDKAADKEQMNAEMTMVNAETQNGEQEGKLFAMYDEAMNSGNTARARAIAEIAGRRKDTAARFVEHHDGFVNSRAFTGNTANVQSVEKQIATGDSARNYRASDGVRFEYAAQFNRGDTDKSFADWRADLTKDDKGNGNIDNAIEHNITNGETLYGQKASSLDSLLLDIQAGRVNDDHLRQLQKIYNNTQNDQFRSSGAYDATKDKILEKINAEINTKLHASGGPTPGPAPGPAPGGATSGGFDVPHGGPNPNFFGDDGGETGE